MILHSFWYYSLLLSVLFFTFLFSYYHPCPKFLPFSRPLSPPHYFLSTLAIFLLPPYTFNFFSLFPSRFWFSFLLLRSKSIQHFYLRLRIRYCVYVLNQIRQETLDQLRLAEISGLLNSDCRPSQPAWIGYVVSVSHSMLLPMSCLFGSIQHGYTAYVYGAIYDRCTYRRYIPQGEPLVTTSNYVQSDHSAISKMDMLRLRKYSAHRRGTKAL